MSASTTTVLECTNSAEFYRAIDCVKALNEVLGIVADHPSRQLSPDTLCILHTLLDDFWARILDGVEEIEVVDHGDEENSCVVSSSMTTRTQKPVNCWALTTSRTS